MRWPISADTIEKFEDWGSLWSSRCYRDGGAWERGGSLRNPVLTAKWRRFAAVMAFFPGYRSAIPLTVAYSAIFITNGP